VTRVYTIWPADREGMPAASSSAWHQGTRWLVLDVTDGLDAAHIVEGPVSRATALHRELEIRVIARQTAGATNRTAAAGPKIVGKEAP
jgi:hypothetical protein